MFLFICACTSLNTSFTTEYNNTMRNEYEGYYTQYQLDSICGVDNIENDLSKWIIIGLRDDESKENVSQYIYIKSLGENECIYRVQKMENGLYKITKRITE